MSQSTFMRLFGTNGIRGKVGEKLTPIFLSKVGLAIGSYLPKGSNVVVGMDTRVSGEMIKDAVVSGLLSSGVNVIDVGIAPTPAIQFYTKNHGDFGIAITASHNPPEFNGVKAIAGDGTELSREEEVRIERIFFSESWRIVGWKDVGKYRKVEGANEEYVKAVLSHVDVEKIRERKFTVVVDCANGASCFTTPYLLERLGCRVVSLNCHPDGTFPGHECEPKEENLQDLISTVKAVSADLGVAHDGDADRAIFVDDRGRFIPGDKTLALVAKEIVKNKGGKVVTPISTSLILEKVVKESGGKVIYTKVGAPIVARRMIEVGAVFGGEENGGMIFPEHQYCRDGALALAKILELMAKSRKRLSEMIDELPKYYQKKINVPCSDDKKLIVLKKLKEKFKNEKIDTSDGVKIWGDDWWILIRPSGTEPLYRMYGEARDEKLLNSLIKSYKKILEEIIESIN